MQLQFMATATFKHQKGYKNDPYDPISIFKVIWNYMIVLFKEKYKFVIYW